MVLVLPNPELRKPAFGEGNAARKANNGYNAKEF
jgi:hypothetical protein